MTEIPDLRLVDFAREREKVFSDLRRHPRPVGGLTDDHQQFLFNVRDVVPGALRLEIVSPTARRLAPKEKIRLTFGQLDGQYFLDSVVKQLEGNVAIVSLTPDSELFRLERRAHFRVTPPPEAKVFYRLRSWGSRIINEAELVRRPPAAPLDLSGGGFRMVWPLGHEHLPTIGNTLGGTLTLGSRAIEVFGEIRMVAPTGALALDAEVHVGLAFKNMSMREEQALLFTCLEIRRKQIAQSA